MLGGQPPFTGTTVESVVHQHIGAKPSPVTGVREAVPSEITTALDRMLAKAPADRQSTGAQVAGELTPSTVTAPQQATPRMPVRRMAIYGATAIAVILGALWILSGTLGPSGSDTDAELPRIAVLPFENLGAPDDEYFSDGMTEEITSRLARISGLQVISRQSAVQYKDSPKSLQEIGGELGVAYVLEGTVRTDRAPDGSGQARITPQLINVSNDAHLWTEPYTVELVPGQVFRVQAQVAEQVAQALDVALLEPERERLADKLTDNLEAYEHYLRGNAYQDRSMAEHDARLAVEMYQGDPEGFLKAQEVLDHARELAPDLTATHLAQGNLHYYAARDFEKALEQFAIVRDREPSNAEAILRIASIQKRLGSWEQAVQSHASALELDPRSHMVAVNFGTVYQVLRRYAEAERMYDHAVALAPDAPMTYAAKVLLYLQWEGSTARAREVIERACERFGTAWWLFRYQWGQQFHISIFAEDYGGALELSRGDSPTYYFTRATISERSGQASLARTYYDSARTVLDARMRPVPGSAEGSLSIEFLPEIYGRLGYAYAALGRKDEAILAGRRAVDSRPMSDDTWSAPRHLERLARIYVLVGEHEAALDGLEYLLSIPSWLSGPLLRLDPFWDPLSSNPRFQALLEKYEN
jgi:serine/threonine-protein kinase